MRALYLGVLALVLAGCEGPVSPTTGRDVSGRYVGVCLLTVADPRPWLAAAAEEHWQATVVHHDDGWVTIRMNKGGSSTASLSFTLEAKLSRSGVVDAPWPNGDFDADCGWMEPVHSLIEFQGATLYYELDHETDRCGRLERRATLVREIRSE